MATRRTGLDRAADEHDDTATGPAAHRAVDGQHVVDQRTGAAIEQAQIQRTAARHEKVAAQERGTTPSTRFWDSPSRRMGAIFALLAAGLTIAMRIWPIVPPQAHIDTRFAWWVASLLVGATYLGGFFLADRYWQTARMLLIVAGLAQLGIGLLAGASVQDETGETGGFALFLEAAPAVLAFLAAFLIRPPEPASR
jgi:hypothetical protein